MPELDLPAELVGAPEQHVKQGSVSRHLLPRVHSREVSQQEWLAKRERGALGVELAVRVAWRSEVLLWALAQKDSDLRELQLESIQARQQPPTMARRQQRESAGGPVCQKRATLAGRSGKQPFLLRQADSPYHILGS